MSSVLLRLTKEEKQKLDNLCRRTKLSQTKLVAALLSWADSTSVASMQQLGVEIPLWPDSEEQK